MSCTLSREFPLLPFEPVPQGPTLAYWRDELAKWASGLATEIEGCQTEQAAQSSTDLSAVNAAIAALELALSDFIAAAVIAPVVAFSNKIISASLTLPVSNSAIIADYISILAGVTVTLLADATLQIT